MNYKKLLSIILMFNLFIVNLKATQKIKSKNPFNHKSGPRHIGIANKQDIIVKSNSKIRKHRERFTNHDHARGHNLHHRK